MLLKLQDLVHIIAPEGRIRQIQSMNNQPVLLQISTINFSHYGIVRIMNKEHNLLFIRLCPVWISCIPVLQNITGR